MRYFAALTLPGEQRRQLDDFCEVRRDADRDWSWTLPDQWHVTLAFAETVPPGKVEPWLERLAEVAAATEPFQLQVGRAGTFPHPDAAKVLYLAVDAPTPDRTASGAADPLARLARAVRTAAQQAGVACDGRRFTPHLTLARSRRGVSATRWLRIFDTVQLPAWQVGALQLVESQWPGPGRRAVHRLEAELAFG